MAEVRLTADERTEFGKGAARRTRRAGKVPAVLYGHGTDPVHLSLPGHDTMLALKTPNVLLTLAAPGGEQLAIPKHVQRDPIKGFVEHVDLLLVRRGERVTVDVAVVVTGAAAPDTLVQVEQNTLPIEADATALPGRLEVDVEGAAPGTQVLARAVPLPPGVTLQADPDSLVVHVTAAQTAADVEAELAEAEAEVGIVHEPSDADVAAAAPTAGPAEVEGAADPEG